MNEYTNIDVDYELMDDLPLSDRIEWNQTQFEKVVPDDWNDDQIKLQVK